ncbi:MAG TPA: DUF2934 domain-containing protein [Blastocatellia bacterium]|nr:DUF2934 domain-containing protein [Blastocatellia bacterium]
MSRENTRELRERLLRNPEVQNMIRVRAFEIYERRGRLPGHDAENWFQAEQEVLTFLIEEEGRRAEEVRRSGDKTATVPESAISVLADERDESQAGIGAWSPAEPASEERAPAIGGTTEPQIEPAKKSRARTSTKSTSARKTKAASATTEGAKKPARRTASKKSDETTAKKTTRKQTKSEESGQ